jgi:hypothetical protein
MLVLAMEFSRDERAESTTLNESCRQTRQVAPSKRNRGSARLLVAPAREVETYDRDGFPSSRIASDQLRSSSQREE